MEGLESHLSTRFADTLGSHGPYGAAGLSHGSAIPAEAVVEEMPELLPCRALRQLAHLAPPVIVGVVDDTVLVQVVEQIPHEPLRHAVVGGHGRLPLLALDPKQAHALPPVGLGGLGPRGAKLERLLLRQLDVSRGAHQRAAPHHHPVEVERLAVLPLHQPWVQPVVPVPELHHLPVGVAHRPVVADRQVLQGLHQPARHVPALGRLDRRVDEPLPPRHRVHEELGGGEPAEKGVFDKPLGGWVLAVDAEVREGAANEAVGDASAGELLLAYAPDHLGYVLVGPFALAQRHHQHLVVIVEGLLGSSGDLVANLVELLTHQLLEGKLQVAARNPLQLALLVRGNELLACVVGAEHDLPLCSEDGGRGHDIFQPKGEAVQPDPPGAELCDPRHPVSRRLSIAVPDEGVEERVLVAVAERRLAQRAAHELRVADADVVVVGAHAPPLVKVRVRLLVVLGLSELRVDKDVDPRHDALGALAGQHQQVEELLARPELDWLHDGWGGKLEVVTRITHEAAEERQLVPVVESVFARDEVGPREEVLRRRDDGGAVLGGADVVDDAHQLEGLGARLLRLGDVQVHLVAVEVGVVGLAHALVEPEGAPRKDLGSVRHD
mmetsp:Transcript_6640/g.16012  ORF Transcript_6640/g.16012 Transcript_6640/m.16012 type:complete len:609 (-) Transcript_6640:1097-2923(-)